MKIKKLYLQLFFGFLGLVFVIFMAVKVVPSIFVTLTKAAPSSKVSLSNSYFIGGKILAKADGVDECTVNVFVLDSSGKGIKGTMTSVVGMEAGEIQEMSDTEGRAVFKISSLKEGQYTLMANIGGVPLEKTLKVTFRN